MTGKPHRQTAPGTSVINIQTNKAFIASVLRECPKLFHGRIGLMKGEALIALCKDAVPYQVPINCVTQGPLERRTGPFISRSILEKMTPGKPGD